MAISRDELIKKIGDWRKGNRVDKLSDAYLEYLDSVLEKEGYDTFATDPDTGEELDDYTPEFEATQAEVLDDLGLSDKEIEMIMNGEWPNPNAVPWPSNKGTGNTTPSDKTPDNPVTTKTVIDKDDDGDADVTVIEQNDGNDDNSENSSDEPHDKELAGDTTLEEDLMLNQNMSPEEFSKRAAEKRGAKKGEAAPDMDSNSINQIAKHLANYRF